MRTAHDGPGAPSPRRTLTRLLTGALAASLPAAFLVSSAPGALAAPASAPEETDATAPFELVDQFVGTELDTTQNKSNDAYGNAYPGAALPFGMVQSSPTTFKTDEGNHLVQEKGGYEYTADTIRGFGMTRYQGTGCHDRFGGYEFPTIPYTGELGEDGALPVIPQGNIEDYYLPFSHENETAEPGYYAVTTDNGVTTELTATERTAVSRYDFAEADGSTLILNASGQNNRSQAQSITVDPETNTVSGWMRGADLCDNGNYYRAYFSTTFDAEIEAYGVWNDGEMTPGQASAEKTSEDDNADFRDQTGAWITFEDDSTVTSRTGLSYVSAENAAENRAAEADGLSFDEARAEARSTWEEQLDTVQVTGGTQEERTKFYSAMYRSFLHPNVRNDVNGQYRGYDGEVHTVQEGRDFYMNFAGSGWDMYRSQAQLIGLTNPAVASDINQSIVALTEQTGGWAPGAARMQGDSLQTIVATLDDMGATDYDRQAALDSMIATQTLPAGDSTRTDAYQYFTTQMIENRKGDFATSRVLEYSINDFSIAQLAESLGNEEANDFFMGRAQSWLNVFDPESQHIMPRDRGGFDSGFDLRNRDGNGGGQFNQSTGYQYGWMVPHNLATLIERRGGVEKSTAELDMLMEDLDAGAYTQTGNYLSNQPALSTPWVYNWLRAPEKSTDVLYRAVEEMYDTTPSGLPGNDDHGSLSAWYVFANIGLYPAVYGTGDLVVTAPMFEDIVIDAADSERQITISAPAAGDTAKYTTGLAVNGEAQSASWLDAEFVRDGGSLAFTMGEAPGTWGTGEGDVPPSYTEGVDARNNVGTSPDGKGEMGSMDLSDWSFSRESLAAAGAEPGAALPLGETGLEFTWPETEPGQPDNWIPHGQRIDLQDQQAGSLSFLGLATNGPAQGTAVVEYTDGSTQDVPVYMTDWASNPGGGNQTVLEVNGRNNGANSSGGGTFRLFGTRPALLDQSKTVDAVRLPQGTDQGIMHIVDVAVQAEGWTDPDAPEGQPHRIVLNPAEDPSTSQYVTWRSTAQRALAGTAEVRVAGSGESGEAGEIVTVPAEDQPQRTVDGYPSRSHSALLEGLEPETAYEYRVGSGESWSEWHSFTTASAAAEPFDFVYFGDAQNGIDTVFRESVDLAQEHYPEAELGMFAGDLVDHATSEEQWTDWFSALDGFSQNLNVLTSLGNHEIGGQPFIENFRDSFEYASNGPVAADAQEYEGTLGAHYEQILQDTVYFTDYQGVRFVNLNANRDDICPITEVSGGPEDCNERKKAWVLMQATWLDRVLAENPNDWTVVMAHQPVFSTGVSGNGLRDETDWRQQVLPVLERHNVDLVLQGHDHTYGRGYHSSTATDTPGLSAGPVYVVSNAGEKMYTLPSATDNVWTRNGAEAVTREQDTATVQGISVDGDTLTYESVASYTRDGGASTVAEGEVLDSFTITKREDGAKWVTDPGTEVPGEDVEPVNAERPFSGDFDPESFGEVVWEDDFSTDRLDEYEVFRDGAELAADLAVDTEAGLLTSTSADRRFTHVGLPAEAGEEFALIVEPEHFAGAESGEDSLFLGLTDSFRDRAHSWYNHAAGATGFDVIEGGQSQNLSTGAGSRPVTWEEGDRLAAVYSHGELTSWIEKAGEWQPLRSAALQLTMDREDLAGWQPTLSLRQDAGTLALDQVTLIQPGGEPAPEPEPEPTPDPEPAVVVPQAVTADLEAGTYAIPAVEGLEYLVADLVMEPGVHEGTGLVTVTARALEGYEIPADATASWEFDFPTAEPQPEAPEFTDNLAGTPFYAQVRWMASNGISTGYQDGTFRKYDDVTRGETTAFLHRYVKPDFTAPESSGFTDVAEGTFFLPITWAADAGLTIGYADGTFRPHQDVTRAEFATFLYRLADPEHTAPATSPFRDLSPDSANYEQITWLAAQGITIGDAHGNFNGYDPVTRGETAAFLQRFDLVTP